MLDLRLHLPKPPFVLIAAIVLLLSASLVPVALFLLHRVSYHAEPRVHLWQDMDNQPRFKPQHHTPVFADGRTMRPPVPGTVARSHLDTDDHFNRGFELVADGSELKTVYLPSFPDQVHVDDAFVQLGQNRFNAMCSPCHGKDGRGHGPVNARATELMAVTNPAIKLGTNWVSAADLTAVDENSGKLKFGEALYPNGQIFSTITVGKGNMVGYGHAIPIKERWAIVAYVRALQLAQNPDAVKATWAENETDHAVARTD